MRYPSSKYHSRIYRDFKGLAGKDYRSQIRYYEKWEAEILQLEFEEYLDLVIDYTNALFETGAYRKHLLMADVVIELAILQNIRTYHEEDLYRKFLFRKAASLYNLMDYRAAEHILRELIKMDPKEEDCLRFFEKCRRKHYPDLLNQFRAASIFFLLLAAFGVALEVLMVRPFYGMYVSLMASSRNTLFVLGVLAMVAGHGYIRFLAASDKNALLDRIRQAKK
ncbi:MAG: hypothetical protein IPH16_03045 [Haliscomenobacter sp.]|nr:hypothetical protein [Haliscomenobacter sp.]MBK8879785.1 hypothetical protein [Haliscomenobacter sp.]